MLDLKVSNCNVFLDLPQDHAEAQAEPPKYQDRTIRSNLSFVDRIKPKEEEQRKTTRQTINEERTVRRKKRQAITKTRMASLLVSTPLSPESAEPATTTTNNIGPRLTGIWKEVSITNLDGFLQAIGIGWVKRKAAALLIKPETHLILYNPNNPNNEETIIIRTLGKRGGPDEKKLNIGKPTRVMDVRDPEDPTDSGTSKELLLHLTWNENKDVLLNDLVAEGVGALHVDRLLIGSQMKVEVTHKDSGIKMHRMFTKVEQSETRVSEDSNGKLCIADA
jgi:hypothetical protein